MSFSDCVDIGELKSTVLIFGGPYSNLEATRSMLLEADKLNIPPQNIICTGDTVAYAAEPEQCCELIRQSKINLLMGNCEESLASRQLDCGCGFEEGMLCSTLSQDWYQYAQSHVSDTTREWMHHLPGMIKFTLNDYRCAVTHGSLTQINRFIFHSTDIAIKQKELELANADIVIGGHCGLPFGQVIGKRLWLNAAVIGLPANDATPDGWYLLMEPESEAVKISWHRLQYDYQKTYQTMKIAGLDGYADAIINGLWPSMDILPDSERKKQSIPLKPEPMIYQKS